MIPGFNKIVEERIRKAQRKGAFDNLKGSGEPLDLLNDQTVPEELRIAYKILKNAACLPPEIELKNEIRQAEDLLGAMTETKEKYRAIKKLNFLIMKLNTLRGASIEFEEPQRYSEKLVEKLEASVIKNNKPE